MSILDISTLRGCILSILIYYLGREYSRSISGTIWANMPLFPALIAGHITSVILTCFLLGASRGSTFIFIIITGRSRSRISTILAILIIIITSAWAGVWFRGTLILGFSAFLGFPPSLFPLIFFYNSKYTGNWLVICGLSPIGFR